MTADITVWANDRCSKSRGAEAILQERGVDYLRIPYLEDTRHWLAALADRYDPAGVLKTGLVVRFSA